ncbi:M23 family metallopeptidase [Octadecabacter sp. R77987]|uniref:M23 family metallopeptidase n=1 Tax=Octadecabacter sp. R77987 TaxID=3093874 RepID=UPI003671F08E
MKLGLVAAFAIGTGFALALVLGFQTIWNKPPAPQAIARVADWQPSQMQILGSLDKSPSSVFVETVELAPVLRDYDPPTPPDLNIALPQIAPPTLIWSGEISAGETLDALLSKAGLSARDRAEVALALEAEYDLRRLKPGYRLEVETSTLGALQRVVLSVEAGVQIEAVFLDRITTRRITPEPELIEHAADTTVQTSISATLASAGIPARFAVDLAEMLGGTVDFRRDLKGGERLQLMWRETMVGDEMIAQPSLSFATLTVDESIYEIIWPEDDSGNATIMIDGELLRVFAQPVNGARLSSVYGNRRHPIYGDIRMHTGVDFAAPRGTPVYATAPGRISYIGQRGGYGLVVEIAHGSDTMTLYSHLDSVPNELSVGQRLSAGDNIGRVGSTGTATGPNLHYEVRVDGRPTNPMTEDFLASAEGQIDKRADILPRLESLRAQFTALLDLDDPHSNPERL